MHRFPTSRRGLARVVAMATTLALLAGACSSDDDEQSEAATEEAGDEAAGEASTGEDTVGTSCFWSEAITPESNNTQYPDGGARYWYSAYELPGGASLRFTGEYPHARYASFNVYGPDPDSGDDGFPLDGLADLDIDPDSGSSNPSIAGADRTAEERSYAVEVVDEIRPEGARPANTLYGMAPGRPDAEAGSQQIVYRVYVADEGRDILGDSGLPEAELVQQDGSVLTGEDACVALEVDPELRFDEFPTVDAEVYTDLVNLGDPATHPATEPLVWRTFFNPRHALLSSFWTGTDQESQIETIDATRVGGYFSNLDNQYAVAAVNRNLGPEPDGTNLLVLAGVAPTTPATEGGEPEMAEAELRYWSLCQNESPVTTRVAGCLYDEQVPRGGDGTYTIVIGRPEDRPENATEACGVAWLDWGPGDGVDRPEHGTLILRHMLPSPDFTATIANVSAAGTEAEVLGDYLPTGTYVSADDFAERGCPEGEDAP